MIIFGRTSQLTQRYHEMELPLTQRELERGLAAWDRGAFIQDAFPSLTPEQREFIKTGITPDEWNGIFGEE